MKIPISKRLLLCASFVAPGARVADIGADHGYLGIYLLREGLASYVYASDLREKPIAKARENAMRFGTADRMEFFCAPGLSAVSPDKVDTVVCAGMGSDCIIEILQQSPWVKDRRFRLILQPQSSGQDLRLFLAREGFSLLREEPVQDAGFLYTVLEAQYDGLTRSITPGRLFLSRELERSGSPLVGEYRLRLINSMKKTLEEMSRGTPDPDKYTFYQEALSELSQMQQ